MPGRDGRGPQGAGPGTGGRRGPCMSGIDEQRGVRRGYAPRGCGRGIGGGQGVGWSQVLHNKAAMLERELEEVRRCIKDYEAQQD